MEYGRCCVYKCVVTLSEVPYQISIMAKRTAGLPGKEYLNIGYFLTVLDNLDSTCLWSVP
jgi:hypothetical protein